MFSYRSQYQRPTHFTLMDQRLPFSNIYCYLGITLDHHLTFSAHVKKKLITARQRDKALFHPLRNPNLSIRVKVVIFNMVIRPNLYTYYTVHHYSENHYALILVKLQQFGNRTLRTISMDTSYQRTILYV